MQQFLAKTFARGFQSYYYSQGSDDSGSGALLGDFQGELVGVGLTAARLPAFGNGKLSMVGKWPHDRLGRPASKAPVIFTNTEPMVYAGDDANAAAQHETQYGEMVCVAGGMVALPAGRPF